MNTIINTIIHLVSVSRALYFLQDLVMSVQIILSSHPHKEKVNVWTVASPIAKIQGIFTLVSESPDECYVNVVEPTYCSNLDLSRTALQNPCIICNPVVYADEGRAEPSSRIHATPLSRSQRWHGESNDGPDH
ncbi:hypothetical protein QAD02_003179 [Eretmocerus hayati]|uniref:Uncharacterized protein n=1 Tax=Eretmocerus hayati TaxID=131215 RepID=A0ACC2NKY6_9HYME|nr:hypothetical protein QAD02_003179 [Eretmocerus hayati]